MTPPTPAALSPAARFDAAFAALPLVAILRGLRPERAVATASVLYDAGFRVIEVPQNAAARSLTSSSAIAGVNSAEPRPNPAAPAAT